MVSLIAAPAPPRDEHHWTESPLMGVFIFCGATPQIKIHKRYARQINFPLSGAFRGVHPKLM